MRHGYLTYRDVLENLKTLSEDQLENTAIIQTGKNTYSECFGVVKFYISDEDDAKSEADDQAWPGDPGQPVFVIDE